LVFDDNETPASVREKRDAAKEAKKTTGVTYLDGDYGLLPPPMPAKKKVATMTPKAKTMTPFYTPPPPTTRVKTSPPRPFRQSFAAAVAKPREAANFTSSTTGPKHSTPPPIVLSVPSGGPKKSKRSMKREKSVGARKDAFQLPYIVNPEARINGQAVVNGIDVRRLKFVKPSGQCFYWETRKHKYQQPSCPYWHPREICKFHPYCPMGAEVCGFGHPFCSAKHYCRCNSKDAIYHQLNHLTRPTDEKDHRLYINYFIAHGGHPEQEGILHKQAPSTAHVGGGGEKWMCGPRQVQPSSHKPSGATTTTTAAATTKTKPSATAGGDLKKKGNVSGGRFVSLASFRSMIVSDDEEGGEDGEDGK